MCYFLSFHIININIITHFWNFPRIHLKSKLFFFLLDEGNFVLLKNFKD